MLRHSLRVLSVAAVAAFTLGPAPAAAVTLVSDCGDLDKAGETYILVGNIVANPVTDSICLRVRADRITVDLAGHTVTGPGSSSDSAGVSDMSQPRASTVVKNGTVERFGFGIFFSQSSRSTVRGTTASDNTNGIVVGPDSLLKDCTVQRNLNNGIEIGDRGRSRIAWWATPSRGRGWTATAAMASLAGGSACW